MTLYPSQDSFVRGEISPRLHARASLDLYRTALSRCRNFVTLPHGGIRKRGGSYFVGESKLHNRKSVLIPFIFSSDQAYALEIGHLYVRIYAYGARVGTVELAAPWQEQHLGELLVYQSADQMWVTHGAYPTQLITRLDNDVWTIEDWSFDDGPYDAQETQGTKLTPTAYGSITPVMTTNSLPSGTAASDDASVNAFQVFDFDATTYHSVNAISGWVSYTFGGAVKKVADAYWVQADNEPLVEAPTSWDFQGYDGADWITLDTRVGETAWTSSERRYFDFINETAFEAYRFKWGSTASSGPLTQIAAVSIHERGEDQTPFNLVASSMAGINDGTGFGGGDLGRTVRLRGSDGRWRWARIVEVVNLTTVKIQLFDHALPDLSPISAWQLGTFKAGTYPEAAQGYEERLAFSRRFSTFLSKSFIFDDFGTGEADDDGLSFTNAGGGQANNIVWMADADGFLLLATTGGIRALSGSGLDEALTPSSFKNRRSRTHGAARIQPVDAGSSLVYVTRSKKALAELTQNAAGRFASEDIGQISEHIFKRGIVTLGFQADPDPVVWFPLETGELGGYTHQPSQEVRGVHLHAVAGDYQGVGWGVVESACVTPNPEAGVDDVWLLVKRTIGGQTKRYIEIMTPPFEYTSIDDAFCVDCGLSYSGPAVGTFTGLNHLEGQTVKALAGSKVYTGLVVTGGAVTLPNSATATKASIGLHFQSEADTPELDVGGRDGSIMGRRKKVKSLILSLLETDLSGLEVKSLVRGQWERARLPTIVPSDGLVHLYTGNIEVPIDDSWEGQGKVTIRHTNPTPCTIRAVTPVFDSEP